MKRVYIAGKLNADAVGYIQNMHSMIQFAEQARRLGCAVFVPCLDFMMGLVHGTYDYDDYFQNNQPWLEASDAICVMDNWPTSKGTQAEIALAQWMGKPVLYGIAELERWLHEGN